MSIKTAATVVGLGKLGAPLLAVLGAKVSCAIGVDLNPLTLEKIKNYQAPVEETGLQSLLSEAQKTESIRVTTELGNAVLDSEIVFIVVPTPSEKSGKFSAKYVNDVAFNIGKALRNTLETQDETYRLFVLVSTVLPGQTQEEFLQVIEETSGISPGKTYGVCYSPEFIALGTVINDIQNPDFVLIGSSDTKAGNTLEAFYTTLCNNSPPFYHTNLVNAELAKLALNCFVTTKISYANMLAELCETIEGANVDEVTKALGLDARISPKFFTGASPYGGPCFPRDNQALRAYANDRNVETFIPDATHETNEDLIVRLAELVEKEVCANSHIVLVGMSYKIGSAEEIESTGTRLLSVLSETLDGITISTVNTEKEALPIIPEASIIVVLLPFMWAHKLDYRGKTVIDCWRTLQDPNCEKLIQIGIGAKNG